MHLHKTRWMVHGLPTICKFLRRLGPTTGQRWRWSYRNFLNLEKLTRPPLIRPPPIGPRTQADHGADSATGHPGCMWNRFRSFRCSGVRKRWVRGKCFCGAQIMSPPNRLRGARKLPVAHRHPIIVVVEASSSSSSSSSPSKMTSLP
jgi:hypothetical protein